MRILLVVYDNASYITWFPQGLAYIAAVMRNEGVDVEIYNQDFHHSPDEKLTEYLDHNKFDAIGVSVIGGYYQYHKLLTLSEAINRSKNRPYYMIGGHGPAPEPEYFLKKTKADCVVIGEGEETIKELVHALSHKTPLHDVKGIAFMHDGKFVQTPRRELIVDIDSIPMPAYDMFPIEYYRLIRMPHCTNTDFILPVLSGRGCKFECNFCFRLDKGLRERSDESIIEEIRYLQRTYGITFVSFSDELLMSSVARTIRFCESLIKAKVNIKWDCNGRLNFATPEVLKLMKESGCVFINYGIEAFDDQILKNMNKALTTKIIVSGIEATLAAGLSPGYNIIFGNIGENRRTLMQGVDFLLKYDDGAQMRTIRPVTPYPGCPLYYHAIEQGLLKDVEDFYENKHTNSDLMAVNFTDMTDAEFYEALNEANQILLTNYFDKKGASYREQTRKLYMERDASFRGYRQT